MATVHAVLAAVDLPLIISGCDVPSKDQDIMPKVAEAALLAISSDAYEDYDALVVSLGKAIYQEFQRTWQLHVLQID